MPEVKKPKQLKVSVWTVRAKLHMSHPVAQINGVGVVTKPEEARCLARWLDDYAAWAKSLEPEFDERNE